MQSHPIPSHAKTAWWRLDKVVEQTSLSRSTIIRKVKEGTFPESHKMRTVNARVWLQSEVEEWKANELDMGPSQDTSVSDLL